MDQTCGGNAVTPGTCPRCGAARNCAMEQGVHPCWCAVEAPLARPDAAQMRCLCRRCLQQLLAAQAAADQPAA
ncbi:MAG: cysteine-rich CWC family protein [Rhodocyclaceae bacterium]|nr:cysteine-rich CWC family protein [Rhodocyclaceae bacterium]MBX3670328.1 cysteine-rich CWC family protein [Rhodocyclaceae bacterium]